MERYKLFLSKLASHSHLLILRCNTMISVYILLTTENKPLSFLSRNGIPRNVLFVTTGFPFIYIFVFTWGAFL